MASKRGRLLIIAAAWAFVAAILLWWIQPRDLHEILLITLIAPFALTHLIQGIGILIMGVLRLIGRRRDTP